MEILKRNFIWIVHVCFWILYFVLVTITANIITNTIEPALLIATVSSTVTIPFTYLFLLYLLPQYWDKQRFLKFSIYVIIVILLSGFIRNTLVEFFLLLIYDLDGAGTRLTGLFQFTLGGTFILLLSIPLRFFDIYQKKMNIEQNFKTHKLEAELRFLRAQVNPHFLFNALNNIYSLSFTKSDLAPEMILKLSDMMSFMLYDCKEDRVLLISEIKYLQNYIALQQLRKSGNQNITLDVEGNVQDIFVSPMIFIPFFENAIKHGNIDDTISGFLNSRFRISKDSLHFSISNTVGSEQRHSEKGGVGLENVRRRLDLLYPNRHRLQITQAKSEYKVTLKIHLNNDTSFNDKL